MDDTAKRKAEELTEKALAHAPICDFREAYRERLRWLRENQPDAFGPALSHYNEVLIPNIANGADPVREWLDFGRRLAALTGRGQLVRVDETGRARDCDDGVDGLLLHLPDDTGRPALALAQPRAPSDAQAATAALLIRK